MPYIVRENNNEVAMKGYYIPTHAQDFDSLPNWVDEPIWRKCGRTDVKQLRCIHNFRDAARYQVEFCDKATGLSSLRNYTRR